MPAGQRRSVWFWITLVWLAAMLFANTYDERLVQSSTFLGGALGNVLYLVVLLALSYLYNVGHRWLAGVLAALGLLALAAAKFGGVADAAVGLMNLACAAGLYFAPFRAPRPPGAQPSQRYRPRGT